MKLAYPFVCLILGGCASMFPSAKDYVPLVVRIDNQLQYQKDLVDCHAIADLYEPGTSTAQIAQSTVTGATSNSAYGIVNPLVPVAGAVGGAATAIINGHDLTGQNSIKVLAKCLAKMTASDHSAITADPNE